MGLSQFDETFPVLMITTMSSANGTNPADVTPTAVTPYRVDGLFVASESLVAEHLMILVADALGGTGIWTVEIPARAGFDASLPYDVIAALFAAASAAVVLPPGCKIQAAADPEITSGKFLFLTCLGGYV